MINGAHVLIYSNDADADRAFLRDALGFKNIDVGGGWLIFRLPPAEVAVHPAEGPAAEPEAERRVLTSQLYLMCDDIHAEVKRLEDAGARTSGLHEQPWGIATTFRLPSGGELGLYQPKHPVAYNL